MPRQVPVSECSHTERAEIYLYPHPKDKRIVNNGRLQTGEMDWQGRRQVK